MQPTTNPESGFGRIRHLPSDVKRMSDAGRSAALRALSGSGYRFDADRQACANAIGDASRARDMIAATTKSIRAHIDVSDAIGALENSIVSLQPQPQDLVEPKGFVGSRKAIIAYFDRWSSAQDRVASELDRAAAALGKIDQERERLDGERARAGQLLTRADEVLHYFKAMDDTLGGGIDSLKPLDRNEIANLVLNPLRASAASLLDAMAKAVKAYEGMDETIARVESTREPTSAMGRAFFAAAQAAAGAGPLLTKKAFRIENLVGDAPAQPASADDLKTAIAVAVEAAKKAKAAAAAATSADGDRGVAA